MSKQAQHTPWRVFADAEPGYFYITDNPVSLSRCNPPCTQLPETFATRGDAEAFVSKARGDA